LREYPDRVLPTSESLEHFTSTLPPSETGRYGFREIKELFYDKHLNNFEVRGIFQTADRNKDNLIDD